MMVIVLSLLCDCQGHVYLHSTLQTTQVNQGDLYKINNKNGVIH